MGATTMTYTCIIMKLRTITVSSVGQNQKMANKNFTQLSTNPPLKTLHLRPPLQPHYYTPPFGIDDTLCENPLPSF